MALGLGFLVTAAAEEGEGEEGEGDLEGEIFPGCDGGGGDGCLAPFPAGSAFFFSGPFPLLLPPPPGVLLLPSLRNGFVFAAMQT